MVVKGATYYIRSVTEYRSVEYGNGLKQLSLHAGRVMTMVLTEAESSELMSKMPNAQFVRDNKVKLVDVVVPDPVGGAPEVTTVPEVPQTAPVIATPTGPAVVLNESKTTPSLVPPDKTGSLPNKSTSFGWPDAVKKIESMSTTLEVDIFIEGDVRVKVLTAATKRKGEIKIN